MPTSKKKRTSNARYIKAHQQYKTIKMKKELYEAFRDKCKANGDSMNGIFVQAVRDYLERD